MNAINRRSFVAGASFGVAATVIAAPIAKPLAAPRLSDGDYIALFARLSPKSREHILGITRFLAEQEGRA